MAKRRNRPDYVHDDIYSRFMASPDRSRKTIMSRMYVRVLTELSCNRFKWDNLPTEIDARFLELTLFRQALVVFFRDENLGRFFALRGAGAGEVNFYDNPTRFMVTGGPTYLNRTMSARHCVPIWANYLRTPDTDIVMIYATKLAEIDRTIELTTMQQRHPYIVIASEAQRLSLLNAMKNINDGEFIIWGTDTFDIDNIKSLDTGIDKDAVLRLLEAKQKIWLECMTLLGINNSNQDKKERLVAAEVGSNDSQILSVRNAALKCRLDAADRINEKYGLHVKVSWDLVDDESVMDLSFNSDLKEDSGSGNLYD